MVIKHKIKMDLVKPNRMAKVEVVQRDQYTRQLELALCAGGESWTIPENLSVIIYFVRADGTGGDYDTLPNGKQAWTASGNVLTVEIAPPVMAKAGAVVMALDLIQGEKRVSTFNVLLEVQKSLYGNYTGPDGDLRVRAFLPMPDTGAVGQVVQISRVDENNEILEVQAVDIPSGEGSIQEVLDREKKNFVCGDVCAQSVNVTREMTLDKGIRVHFGSNRLQGVKEPQQDTDAANKAYVDRLAGGSGVPAYWQSAVGEACRKVTALQDAAGRNAVSFVWFSDCHVQPGSATPNPGHTGRLAAAVMDACKIPFALMGGDAARSDGNALTNEAQMRESLAAADSVFAPIGKERLLQVLGNHDGSWGYKEGLEDPYYCYQMDGKALFGAVFRGQAEDQRRVFGGDGSYFFVDHPASKTRFVLLNSNWVADGVDENGAALNRRMRSFGYGNMQLNWLAGEALSFAESGWAVVIGAHVPPLAENDNACRDGAILRGILNAFAAGAAYTGTSGSVGTWDYVSVSCDFSAGPNAELVGFFGGHQHKDSLNTVDYGFPIVTITSDADLSYDEGEGERVMGTDTEHALDIVTIDRERNRVSLTRLGVGSDRDFFFDGGVSGINNLADSSSADWKNDSRLNSSAQVVANAGSCVTNWIPCNAGDVVRISGLNVLDSTSGYVGYENIYLDAVEVAKCASYASHFATENGAIRYTIFTINSGVSDAWQGKVRFSGALTAGSAEDVVITVNQEI